MSIPDEAVRTARDVLWREMGNRDFPTDEDVRAALAAALPHLCLFPERLVPSGDYHGPCGECQRCDPNGLLNHLMRLRSALEEIHAIGSDPLARCMAYNALRPGDEHGENCYCGGRND